MTWHLATATRDGLLGLLAEIKHTGGTVTSCRRCAEGMLVTWFTA